MTNREERRADYQNAAHAAALAAAKQLVAKLEAEGPGTGWYSDNQNTAIRVLEIIGDDARAEEVGRVLNALLYA